MQRQKDQIFRRLNFASQRIDHERIIQVPPLGNLRHDQMVFDQKAKHMGLGAIQAEAAGYADRHLAADLFMVSGAKSLARVVQQQSEVKYKRRLDAAKHLRVAAERRRLGIPNLIEFGDAEKRMFIGRYW